MVSVSEDFFQRFSYQKNFLESMQSVMCILRNKEFKCSGGGVMNDMTEILDNAFCHLQNVEIKERKKAANILMKAACAELGTKKDKACKRMVYCKYGTVLFRHKRRNKP